MAEKNQIGFFKVIVLPMLEAFADGFEAARPLLQQARANLQWWRLRTPDNYSPEDIQTYRSAMNFTVEQQPEPSLIDFVTDLDKESKMKLPEVDGDEEGESENDPENDLFGNGSKNWAVARRLTHQAKSRGNIAHKIREISRESLMPSWAGNLVSSRDNLPLVKEGRPIRDGFNDGGM